MKLKIILSLLVMAMTVSTSYASFPVLRTVTSTTTAENTVEELVVLESPAAAAADDQIVALLLWFFLGVFAGHRWYLGSPIGWNILFILTLGGVGVWWIIDGIDIITKNYPGL